MNPVFQHILAGLAAASPLELGNFALGVVGVILMVRRSLAAFPVGMVAVAVQSVLFYRAKFYADATLQIFLFVALAWGWRHWTQGRGEKTEVAVTVLTVRGRLLAVAATAVATAAWALAAQRLTDAPMPWRDAAIAMLQVTGQVLQARKKLENWVFFTAANTIAIQAYWSAELAYTAVLFGIYLVLGLAGWRAWAKARTA